MEAINRYVIIFLFAICFISEAFAQGRQPGQSTSGLETAVPANGSALTGKERSGRKWMDEQRIDNCKVPIDKRGSKPRPDCLHSPSG